MRTGLGKLGIQPHVTEATLSHLPPKLIRTYDRNTYATEKRDALDKWAAHLKVAVGEACKLGCEGIVRKRVGSEAEEDGVTLVTSFPQPPRSWRLAQTRQKRP